ncbi:MAG TPA: magnesium transporter CorA family protein [Herpetosiphonaceae bacterium]
MLTIFQLDGKALQRVETFMPGCWLHVTDPSATEIDRLVQLAAVPPAFVSHALDIDELARIDHDQGQSLIILRIPHYVGPIADIPYQTVALGIILNETAIITISRVALPLIDLLITTHHAIPHRERLILLILLETAQQYVAHVQQINQGIEQTEARLRASLRNQELFDLLKFQKSLVYFTTGLKANQLIVEHLQKGHIINPEPDDYDLLEDVMIEYAQATEMTSISGDILSQMMDAFASIIANNLNVVMKVLAAFTVILSFPTIIASLYGMNVGLPFQKSPLAFSGLLLLSLIISVIVGVLFWRRHWL